MYAKYRSVWALNRQHFPIKLKKNKKNIKTTYFMLLTNSWNGKFLECQTIYTRPNSCTNVLLSGSEDKSPSAFMKMTYPNILVAKFS